MSRRVIEVMINNITNFTNAHTLVDFSAELLNWEWVYATSKNGKKGHFITVSCRDSIVLDLESESFFEGVRSAGRKMLEQTAEVPAIPKITDADLARIDF